jgi:hypothetical protein
MAFEQTPVDQLRGSRGELGAFEAHDDAMGLSIQEVVRRLVRYLGATTVAAIGGVSETRAVKQWMEDEGRQPQRPDALRFALQIASMIANAKDSTVARAWFRGCNPHLNDQVPALLLRDRDLHDVQAAIMAAARSFAARNQ